MPLESGVYSVRHWMIVFSLVTILMIPVPSAVSWVVELSVSEMVLMLIGSGSGR